MEDLYIRAIQILLVISKLKESPDSILMLNIPKCVPHTLVRGRMSKSHSNLSLNISINQNLDKQVQIKQACCFLYPKNETEFLQSLLVSLKVLL